MAYNPERNSWNEGVRRKWWQFGAWRLNLYEATRDKTRVLIGVRVTKHLCFKYSDPSIVFGDSLNVVIENHLFPLKAISL